MGLIGSDNKWVTNEAREIGIGPTLFLMTQKAFAYLFIVFFILNLPLMFFYYNAGGSGSEGKVTDIFG